MLVMIKSGPDTTEGKRGIGLARDMSADVCLMQNAVYFGLKGKLAEFGGTVYLMDDDRGMRGLGDEDLDEIVKKIDYDRLVDLMTAEEVVVGLF